MIPYTNSEVEFQLNTEIGEEGRNSQVFIAHDNQLDTKLVIKRINRSTFTNEDEYFQEASILYKSSHDYVVPIQYASKDSHYIYIALPYYPNGSLKKIMNQRFLTLREILRYSSHFLSGLHNIHSKGLIHFDLKPDNILITTRNEAILSDFGLAKHTCEDGLAEQNSVYVKQVPPEKLDAISFTNSFDIYQVGLTLYRMCNGDEEFDNQFNSFIDNGNLKKQNFIDAVRSGTFPNRDKFPEHIPNKIRTIIKKCLKVTPDDRYKTIIDLINDLSNFSDENCFDWQFEQNQTNKKWIKNIGNRQIYIILNNNGSTIAKRVNEDGIERRITSYIKPSISLRELQKFFKEN